MFSTRATAHGDEEERRGERRGRAEGREEERGDERVGEGERRGRVDRGRRGRRRGGLK